MSFGSELENHLTSMQWLRTRCIGCGRRFWSVTTHSRCQRCSAAIEPHQTPFPVIWTEVWPILLRKMSSASFRAMSTVALARDRTRSTLFIGSGLQIFETVIFDGEPIPSGRLFVHQPVLRLNYFQSTDMAGYGTSFVNVCTEEARGSEIAFLEHLNAWVSALSAVGLSPEVLELELVSQIWTGGPFSGTQILLKAHNVTIGDGVFITSAALKKAACLLPIVDFSFGLERIVGSINRSADYWPFIGPLPDALMADARAPLDALKSAVLLVSCGVEPSARRHGRELRRLYKRYATWRTSTALGELVRVFYEYWSSFLPNSTTVSADEVCWKVIEGVHRARLAESAAKPS